MRYNYAQLLTVAHIQANNHPVTFMYEQPGEEVLTPHKLLLDLSNKNIALWFLGALDDGGEIWKWFLICMMLSRVFIIAARHCLTKVSASFTSRKLKGRDSQVQAFFLYPKPLKLTTLCKKHVWVFVTSFKK